MAHTQLVAVQCQESLAWDQPPRNTTARLPALKSFVAIGLPSHGLGGVGGGWVRGMGALMTRANKNYSKWRVDVLQVYEKGRVPN